MKLSTRRPAIIAWIAISLLFMQCNTKETPPNVVLFLVDDLGWTDVGCYGSDVYETPNIDALASSGVRFTNAYAACHVCSPTRASILTGKYPARLNLTDWLPGRKDYAFQKLKNVEINQHLPFDETTLAEALKANGYQTGIFGKWHLGEDPSGPLKHGFDVHVPEGWNKGWPLSYYAPFRLNGYDGNEGEYLTDRLTTDALKYIEDNKDKPFFLYLPHYAVHDPIEGRKDLVEKYNSKLKAVNAGNQAPYYILEGNPDGNEPVSVEERTTLLGDEAFEGFSGLPKGAVKIKQRQDNPHFAAMVESMDESLGRVVEKLRELDLDENTVIIFYSDNGGMAAANFGNPDRKINPEKLDKAFSTSNLPLRGAKGWLYEGGIRVPLIVRWPDAKNPGSVCDVPVTSTDLFPTILEMLDLPLQPEQHVDGKSMVSLLKEEGADDRPIYWHFPHYSNHGMQSPGGAIRYKDYKLIEYFENGTVQLFNLAEDLKEEHDLSQAQPEKVEELRKMLQAWRANVSARMMPPNPEYVAGAELKK